jgi:uncharacterized protein YbdZ (MbtH family)
MYFLLVREDSFTLWSEKALLPCKWQISRRSELTLKEENSKYKLTLEFIQWNG